MEPPFLPEELRNLLLWLTLACLSKNLDQKRMVKQEVSLPNARKWVWFYRKWAWPRKFRAMLTEPPFKKSCIRHCRGGIVTNFALNGCPP